MALRATDLLPQFPEQPRWFTARDTVFLIYLLGLAWWLLNWAWIRSWNGYRGLHEWLSGTRVVRLPSPSRVAPRPRHDRGPTPETDGVHGHVQFGPYQVRQCIHREEAGAEVFLADDPNLGRRVWVVARAPDEAPPRVRREVTRPTRQRWLDGGDGPSGRWDAYAAPLGVPLRMLIISPSGLPWRDAMPILYQVSGELTVAETEGTIPRLVSEDQVLVEPGGRVTLADYPPGSGPRDAAEPLEFLKRVARLAAGRPLGVRPRPPGGPVPVRAGRFLDRLLGAAEPFPDLPSFATELHTLHSAPTDVSRPWRGVRLAIVAVLCFPGLFMLSLMEPSSLSEAERFAESYAREALLPGPWTGRSTRGWSRGECSPGSSPHFAFSGRHSGPCGRSRPAAA